VPPESRRQRRLALRSAARCPVAARSRRYFLGSAHETGRRNSVRRRLRLPSLGSGRGGRCAPVGSRRRVLPSLRGRCRLRLDLLRWESQWSGRSRGSRWLRRACWAAESDFDTYLFASLERHDQRCRGLGAVSEIRPSNGNERILQLMTTRAGGEVDDRRENGRVVVKISTGPRGRAVSDSAFSLRRYASMGNMCQA
jgi:hypothetical protein